jgi:hypothetical protein
MLLIPDRDSNVQFADHQPSPLTAQYMLSTYISLGCILLISQLGREIIRMCRVR